ncbi:MAK10-like protein [Tanacetum coccineum]
MRDENPIRTLGDYSKPSHEGYRNTIELPVGNNMVPLRSDTIRLVQNGCSFHELRSEDPNQYLKDFLKLVDSLDLDGSITTWEDLTTRFLAQFFPRGRTAKFRNDILMFQQHHGESLSEAWTHAPSTFDRRLIELKNQVQCLMESHLAPTQPTQVNKITTSCEICNGPHDTQYCMEDPEQAFVEYVSSRTDEAGNDMISKVNLLWKTVSEKLDDTPFVTLQEVPQLLPQNPIITEGCLSNLKIPCNIRHVHVEKAYIDLNSPIKLMTQMMYNWIMRRKLDPRENSNRGVSNFTGRIKGMHVFVGNFTFVTDFMIVEDISSIIDPRISQVVLGKPFVDISNMTHDPPEGVVRFTNETDEIAYKMPHKIERYNSLSDLEKEHTKLVYLRNEEDKRRGVEYVIFDEKKLGSS